MRLKTLAIASLLAIGASSSAFAQCQGNPPAGRICANGTAAPTLPSWYTQSVVLDRNFGAPSGQGTILNRGASLWSATSTPSLGLNGTTGGSLTLNGSSTGSAVLGVKAAAGSVTFNLPITNGSLNNVLITDGSGNTSWTSAGSGTVSSVGLALPASILTVSGSPVTTTGTLTGTLATQSANLVWAGPTTGAAATPTFRSLVGADLPNPAPSTLGGVESLAAVASNWIRAISTSGVPTASQPAFTDISGTVAAAQLPNPTASTLGGIESFASVSHQWINTISTSGVPSSIQPAFTDISGQTVLGQLPTMGSNSILSNITGGSATPLANSLTAIIDSAIDNTQGDILYRSGTVWTALNPGTSGQVLTTAGASANPSWTTVTGTGTVTSVATNNGVTGGTITTTGTIGLATIASGNVLANTSGGSAVPTANTPTKVLDVIGATEGDILYRGASVWTALAPGTNGQFLQTTGAASTPQWAAAVSISGSPSAGQIAQWTNATTIQGVTLLTEPQGRLTLVANTPVMTSNQIGISTLRYDNYHGNQVPYYNGTVDQLDTITSSEVTDAMVSAASAGQVVSGQIYDVWWVHGGANRICLAMSASTGGGGGWASDTGGSNTARGSGYSQLNTTFRPYITNQNSITNCFNAATNYGPVTANQGTYLGSIYATANGQTSMAYKPSPASGGNNNFLAVFNAYNQVPTRAISSEATGSWTYATATWRAADNSASNRVNFLDGLQQSSIHGNYAAEIQSSGTGIAGLVGVALDSTTVPTRAAITQDNLAGATLVTGVADDVYLPQIGLHFVQALEFASGATVTFFGTTNAGPTQSAAIFIELNM